ncbi:MAG TPA: VOC family protein [Methylomirabilota bacterium]|nr:VOC family protein [Methylomirabilota bacterium]
MKNVIWRGVASIAINSRRGDSVPGIKAPEVREMARIARTAQLPTRLHHTAYTTKDMEKTRQFYEDVIGLPLVATWSESDTLFGKRRTYCHCFFGLADGGALAFFQFADKRDERKFSPPIPETPFHHIALKVTRATQRAIEQRVRAAG